MFIQYCDFSQFPVHRICTCSEVVIPFAAATAYLWIMYPQINVPADFLFLLESFLHFLLEPSRGCACLLKASPKTKSSLFAPP